jgi:hypothetical protein
MSIETVYEPVLSGKVEWTGENPGIFLKEHPAGAYTALATFFRLCITPFGPGHMLLVLLDVDRIAPDDHARFCVSDNPPMAEWLRDQFVREFSFFREVSGLEGIPVTEGNSFRCTGDARREWREEIQWGSHRVVLSWGNLGEPFAVAFRPEHSATGRHTMHSVFVPAWEATIEMDGRRARGKPAPRDLFGRPHSTALLAFSETWVRHRP